MKKFYIRNFRNIYKEISFDLESTRIASIIGKNGSGKTNILEALDWFSETENYNTFRYENIKSRDYDDTVIDNDIDSNVTYISDISVKLINKINDIIEEVFGEKILFRVNNEISANKFIVITKSDSFPELSYNKNFTNEEGIEFVNFLRFIVHEIIDEYINTHNKAGISLENYFVESSLDWHYLSIESTNIEQYDNYVTELDQYKEKSAEEKEKVSKPKPPFKEDIYQELKIMDSFLIKIDELFNVNNFISINYIENANTENNVKNTYEINAIKNDASVGNLVNFLDNYFKFSSLVTEMISTSKLDVNSDQTTKTIERMQERLSSESKEAINELFSSFDIYALPTFAFANNKLTISVRNKRNLRLGSWQVALNSSGFKAFFEIILRLNSVAHNAERNIDKTYLILSDEPEQNLHIKLQSQMMSYIRNKVSDIKNIHFICASHSPYIVDVQDDIYNVSYFSEDDYSGSLKLTKLNTKDILSKSIDFNEVNDFMLIIEAAGIIKRYNFNNISSIDDLLHLHLINGEKFIAIENEIANLVVPEYEDKTTLIDVIRMNINNKKYEKKYIVKAIENGAINDVALSNYNVVEIAKEKTADIICLLIDKEIEDINTLRPILVKYK
jgi:ABC-type lipoprotein export system ATPase subunit